MTELPHIQAVIRGKSHGMYVRVHVCVHMYTCRFMYLCGWVGERGEGG